MPGFGKKRKFLVFPLHQQKLKKMELSGILLQPSCPRWTWWSSVCLNNKVTTTRLNKFMHLVKPFFLFHKLFIYFLFFRSIYAHKDKSHRSGLFYVFVVLPSARLFFLTYLRNPRKKSAHAMRFGISLITLMRFMKRNQFICLSFTPTIT